METSDGREFTVGLTDTTLRPDRAQPRRALRRCDRPDARHARARAATCSPTGSSIPRAATHVRRQDARRSSAAHAARVRLREAGLVGQADLRRSADFYFRAQFPDGDETGASTARARHDRQQDRRPPGDGHDLPPDLRPLDRVPHDRARTASSRPPRRASSTCASTCATSTRPRASPTGTTPSRSDEPSEKKILASRVRRRLPAIPAYEQIYALVGPAQTYRITGDPRIQEDIDRRSRSSSGTSTTPSTAATGRTSTRSRSTARATRWAETGRARTGTRSATTSPAYLINAWLATGEDKYMDMLGRRSPTPSSSASPTTPTARSSRSGSTRTGATT